MLGASPSLIRSTVAAAQSRHTDFMFEPPLNGKLEFKRMTKAVGSLQDEGSRVTAGDAQAPDHASLEAPPDTAQGPFPSAESKCAGKGAGYTAVLPGS
jgi:hypothetical protein